MKESKIKDEEKKEVKKDELEGNKLIMMIANLVDPVNSPLAFGPKLIKFNWIINAQKTGTIFLMFLLMIYYNNFSTGAWLYLSLHGTYGLLWFLKDMVFPDKSFQVKFIWMFFPFFFWKYFNDVCRSAKIYSIKIQKRINR